MPNLKLLLPDLGMLESLELPKHLSQLKLIFAYFVLFLTVAVLFGKKKKKVHMYVCFKQLPRLLEIVRHS